MKYFQLFSNCIPVKGSKRAIIADLHRSRLQFVPLELVDILNVTIECKYTADTDIVVLEYFDFLLEEEYGFLIEESELDFFPKMNMEFKVPYPICNAIVDYGEKLLGHKKIASQLKMLSCKWIQLRFFEEISFSSLEKIINEYTISHTAFAIDIIIPYIDSFDTESMVQLVNKYINIYRVSIYSSPFDSVTDEEGCNIIFSPNQIKGSECCGVINTDTFSLNEKSFSEALNFNSCLNGKISIDIDGNIKNCPSMSKTYGNIEDTQLSEALTHSNFKDLWGLTKDHVLVCKECEFRYICTDCRAYLENPNDIYSKPLKCGYDPHSMEWEEWSTNPVKEKISKYYKTNQ